MSAEQNPFLPGEALTSTICSSFDGSNFTLDQNTISTGSPSFTNLEAACYGIQAKKIFPDPNTLRTFAPSLGQIFSLENVADSHYNGLQATLRRSKGRLSLDAAYSYSHSIDDSSDRFDSTFVNSFDLGANKASSNFDQRHLLNVSYVYDFSIFDVPRDLVKLKDFLQNGPSADPGPSASAPGSSGNAGFSEIGICKILDWAKSV